MAKMVLNRYYNRSRGVKSMVSYSDITLSIAILVSLLKKQADYQIFDHLGGFRKHFFEAQKQNF